MERERPRKKNTYRVSERVRETLTAEKALLCGNFFGRLDRRLMIVTSTPATTNQQVSKLALL